ncbi:hypothetical protein QF034_004499 [Streptomyces africanus]|uniref:Uncharacterized protein n=1 Tax=Streptomyces africanus TaxID=231024 RepID=A0ABU0QSB0_9ACTN|nr:hypothetical protein [Streptomyces africanus]
MGDPDAVQLLVLDQGLHGRVVDGLDLPAAGRGDLDAGLGEGLDHVGRQVGPHPAAERGGHLVGQLGQAPRLTAARVPLTQQVVQHRAMDLGAPGQPGAVHLGGHEHAGRLGGRQQAHPLGVLGLRVPLLLLGVDREEIRQGQVDALWFEQGRLGARFGGALGRIGRYGAAAQPGQGGRGRAWFPVPPLVTEEERLGGLDVVAPLDSHPRGEQARVDLGGGPPHPPRDAGTAPHGLGGIRLPPDRPGGQPVRTEGGDVHATVLGRSEHPPIGHAASVPGGSDNAPIAVPAPAPAALGYLPGP